MEATRSFEADHRGWFAVRREYRFNDDRLDAREETLPLPPRKFKRGWTPNVCSALPANQPISVKDLALKNEDCSASDPSLSFLWVTGRIILGIDIGVDHTRGWT